VAACDSAPALDTDTERKSVDDATQCRRIVRTHARTVWRATTIAHRTRSKSGRSRADPRHSWPFRFDRL
jgi:hypothetical protein